MSNELAIKVENLSKTYQKKDSDGNIEIFHALKDINFEVKKGEVIGVIGKNGSGKSTLLKILSGVTKPTTGKIEINGTVASILDIGTGFHPDLSGRENVYLRGELLGMSLIEIQNAFDDIVDFSEIGDFIEMPVKNYSSGMFLRLAFSIIIFLKADILLLDEVISVGDAGFREKIKIKLNEIINKKNNSIVLVSHNIDEEFKNSDVFFQLENGRMLKQSTNQEIIEEYSSTSIDSLKGRYDKSINKECHEKYKLKVNGFELEQIAFVDSKYKQKDIFSYSEPILLQISFTNDLKDKNFPFLFQITDTYGSLIICTSLLLNQDKFVYSKNNNFVVSLPKEFFNSGKFYLSVYSLINNKVRCQGRNMIYFETLNSITVDGHIKIPAPILLPLNWQEI